METWGRNGGCYKMDLEHFFLVLDSFDFCNNFSLWVSSLWRIEYGEATGVKIKQYLDSGGCNSIKKNCFW